MRKTLQRFKQIERLPGGTRIFTQIVCRTAPYFQTIKPHLEALDAGYARAAMRKRRSVQNHIGTVHAIAMCNMAELVGGLVTEVSIPDNAKWIPSGMRVEYVAKAKTDLVAVADGSEIDWQNAGEFEVPVIVTDTDETVVFRAWITMNVKHG